MKPETIKAWMEWIDEVAHVLAAKDSSSELQSSAWKEFVMAHVELYERLMIEKSEAEKNLPGATTPPALTKPKLQ